MNSRTQLIFILFGILAGVSGCSPGIHFGPPPPPGPAPVISSISPTSATNLIVGGNPAAQVFVRDTCKSSTGSVPACTPSTVLSSVDSTGTPTGGFAAAISDDAHFAAFATTLGGVQQVLRAATGF